MSDTIPRHSYETVAGTTPTASGVHEPRVVKHTVTTGGEEDVYMMYEIGDGVFVQFGDCRACKKRVGECKCVDGPKEPEYAKPWRTRRFERTMDERPEPSYEMLPKIAGWLRDRGYTVTKKGAKPVDVTDLEDQHGEKITDVGTPPTGDKTFGQQLSERGIAEMEADIAADEAVKVDEGLDAALEKVRAAKAAEIDPGF